MFRRKLALGGVPVAAFALAAILAVPTAAQAAPSTPTPAQRSSDTVTADSLPTVQIDDGVVWDQTIVGNTVYAGGLFSQTRPAGFGKGQNLTPRSNLLAYNLTTGNLLPFDVPVNGTVKAVTASPDGKTLYIGGSFTQVGGKSRYNLAAIDLASGTVTSFAAPVGGSFVNGLVVTSTSVYVGGSFTRAGDAPRRNLAAFSTSGALTSWAPIADGQVDDMLLAPQGDRVIVAGRFGAVNGARAKGTASISTSTGASYSWAMNQSASNGVINGGSNASGTMGLATDGTNIYGAAWQHAAEPISNCEGNWAADAATGQLIWMTGGTGDQYGVYASGSTAYSVGHSHYATPYGGWPDFATPDGNYQFSLALTTKAMGTNTSGGYWNNSGKPAPAIVNWYPSWISGKATGMGQAAWTLEGNGKYMVAGGEFQGVNGVHQQGLARFGTKAVTTPKTGPRLNTNPNSLQGRTWETPSFSPSPAGAVIKIRPNYDRDDRDLTYWLYRSGTKTPVASAKLSCDPWIRTSQTVTLTDKSAQGRTSYSYTVRALDNDGNYADSRPVTGTTGAGQPQPVDPIDPINPPDPVDPVDPGPLIPGTVVATDAFGRTGGSWGTADAGGAWSAAKGLSVSGGKGVLYLSRAGETVAAYLVSTNAKNVDMTVGVSMDRSSAGGGSFAWVVARHTGSGDYRVKLVQNANRTMTATLVTQTGSDQRTLGSAAVKGLVYKAGDVVKVRFVVASTGTSTELKAKAWAPNTAEPAAWTVVATDATSSLQGAGQVGLAGYLSASSTLGDQRLRFSDLTVVVP